MWLNQDYYHQFFSFLKNINYGNTSLQNTSVSMFSSCCLAEYCYADSQKNMVS